MHETGAVWQMTALKPEPEMVSAVRTCMTIPVFLLALPAGVWADRFDRRKWLISTQSLLLFVAAAMGRAGGRRHAEPDGFTDTDRIDGHRHDLESAGVAESDPRIGSTCIGTLGSIRR